VDAAAARARRAWAAAAVRTDPVQLDQPHQCLPSREQPQLPKSKLVLGPSGASGSLIDQISDLDSKSRIAGAVPSLWLTVAS
jgi:hypothetical protein